MFGMLRDILPASHCNVKKLIHKGSWEIPSILKLTERVKRYFSKAAGARLTAVQKKFWKLI